VGLSSDALADFLAVVAKERHEVVWGLPPSSRVPGGRVLAPWSHLTPRPLPNHTWVEVVAARGLISGAAFARVLREVFLESATLAEFNEAVGNKPEARLFSFLERVKASGCEHCTPCISLDQSVDVSRAPSWSGGPRKRIALAASAIRAGPVGSADPRAVRHPAALQAEAGCRTMLSSINGSWRSYASGLAAWSAFMDACFPHSPHFPAGKSSLLAFVPFFANGKTCEKYIQHVQFAERVLGLPSQVDPAWVKALIRGVSKFHHRAESPRFLEADVTSLIKAALDGGLLSLARMFAVCRTFMGRAANELHPLQIDGRSGLDSDDTRWHSQVHIAVGGDGRLSATITLRTRKNAPRGGKLIRFCGCSANGNDTLLCGVCALRAQVREHRAAGRGPTELLFPEVSGPGGAAAFRRTCSQLNLAPAWHAFRRGAASDLLRRGAPLSAVLAGGGWRSAAFLRYLSRADIDERVALEQAFAVSDTEG